MREMYEWRKFFSVKKIAQLIIVKEGTHTLIFYIFFYKCGVENSAESGPK